MPDPGGFRQAGEPSRWQPEFVGIAARGAKIGLTDSEIAELLGVTYSTFLKWRHARPELDDAMFQWREHADERVERRLYERCVGYNVPVEKIFMVDGEVKRVATFQHIPGDVRAQELWLSNRRPDTWQTKNVAIAVHLQRGIEGMTDAELVAIVQEDPEVARLIPPPDDDVIDLDVEAS